jgi:hypothetical protein
VSKAPQEIWATLTQAERDAAYNNNLAVTNSAELIERRNALSETYRAARVGALDLPYGELPQLADPDWPHRPAAHALLGGAQPQRVAQTAGGE